MVVRFTKGAFADNMTATIGAAFAMKDVRVDDGSLARLQIWGAWRERERQRGGAAVRGLPARQLPRPPPARADTAGEEIYRAMTRNFFREAAVGLVVYDLTSATSFASVSQWLADFADACPDALAVIVANKADVNAEARVVSAADGAALAAARGLPFFEVSAKSGANIDELFAHVAQTLVTARRNRLLL